MVKVIYCTAPFVKTMHSGTEDLAKLSLNPHSVNIPRARRINYKTARPSLIPW